MFFKTQRSSSRDKRAQVCLGIKDGTQADVTKEMGHKPSRSTLSYLICVVHSAFITTESNINTFTRSEMNGGKKKKTHQ